MLPACHVLRMLSLPPQAETNFSHSPLPWPFYFPSLQLSSVPFLTQTLKELSLPL